MFILSSNKFQQTGMFLSFADNKPPSFNDTCPRNMVVYVPKCSSNVLVNWTEPPATDNSGHVTISYPAMRPPANLTIGLYNVHYSATDDEGNKANCSFIVQVASMSLSLLRDRHLHCSRAILFNILLTLRLKLRRVLNIAKHLAMK